MGVTLAIAKAAAQWWADQLRQPVLLDNGTGGEIESFLQALHQKEGIGVGHPPSNGDVTGAQIQAFQEALNLCIRDEGVRFLSVDYHPDLFLSAALKHAGLSEDRLPIKTEMNLTTGLVRKGYSGQWVGFVANA